MPCPTGNDSDQVRDIVPGSDESGETQILSFSNVAIVQDDTHEVILQGLNQWLPTKHPWVKSGKAFYAVKNFQGTENLWDTVPFIFVPPGSKPQHPVNANLAGNLDAELKRIGGRIGGKFIQTRVVTSGTPRLASKIQFTDQEAKRLYEEGKLELSTGFDAELYENGFLSGKVTPNHVLGYVPEGSVEQNDPKAMFLNTKENGENMAEDAEMKGILSKILSVLERFGPAPAPIQNTGDKMTEELTKKLELANAAIVEKDKTLAAKDAEIADLKSRVTSLENIKAEAEKREKDARWAEIKNTLPKGACHKTEDEAALRKDYEENPAGFVLKALQLQNTKPEGTKKEGVQFQNTGDPSVTDSDRLAKLGIPSLTVMGGAE